MTCIEIMVRPSQQYCPTQDSSQMKKQMSHIALSQYFPSTYSSSFEFFYTYVSWSSSKLFIARAFIIQLLSTAAGKVQILATRLKSLRGQVATDLLVSLQPLGFSKEKTERFVLYSQYQERSDRQSNATGALGKACS